MHHFEDGILVIDSPTIDDAKRSYMDTLAASELQNKDDARLNPFEWILRNIIKIFAPLL